MKLSVMLSEKQATTISKFLSLVLRHQPETVGLSLDENGWAVVPVLLQKLQARGFIINHDDLQYLVASNSKKRFAFNEDETKIRASQGHSIEVDLGYSESIPPPILYHGTASKNREAILKTGLLKQSRQHVHLSTDKETALRVGQRHGDPFVFTVLAQEMHKDGHQFFCSANGVWLTNAVPVNYISIA